jgi:hypothetical protein
MRNLAQRLTVRDVARIAIQGIIEVTGLDANDEGQHKYEKDSEHQTITKAY